MATTRRNVLSLIALLFLVLGTFSSIMIIFDDKKIVTGLEYIEYYQIGSALASFVVVVFLGYLTVTSLNKSFIYKAIIIFFLTVGLLLEIIMINVKLNKEDYEYTKYVLFVFNFLFRAYHLIGYIQEPWAEITFDTVTKGIKTVTSPITGTSSSTSGPEDPKKSIFVTKWKEIREEAKRKYPADVEFVTADKIAYGTTEYTKDKLAEAAAALKKKSDGSQLAGLDIPAMGGKRRTRR